MLASRQSSTPSTSILSSDRSTTLRFPRVIRYRNWLPVVNSKNWILPLGLLKVITSSAVPAAKDIDARIAGAATAAARKLRREYSAWIAPAECSGDVALVGEL